MRELVWAASAEMLELTWLLRADSWELVSNCTCELDVMPSDWATVISSSWVPSG